jgi:hypothetical protein
MKFVICHKVATFKLQTLGLLQTCFLLTLRIASLNTYIHTSSLTFSPTLLLDLEGSLCGSVICMHVFTFFSCKGYYFMGLGHLLLECILCSWMDENFHSLRSLTNVKLFVFLKSNFWAMFFKVTSFANKQLIAPRLNLNDHL